METLIDKYFVSQYNGCVFDINIINNMYDTNYGSTDIDNKKINNLNGKLKNIKNNKIRETKYRYYDMEYLIRKDMSNNFPDNVSIISKKYFVQDIHESKYLVDIHKTSHIPNNIFPIISKYHDEVICDMTEYVFNDVILRVTENNVSIIFTFHDKCASQLKKDLCNIVDHYL